MEESDYDAGWWVSWLFVIGEERDTGEKGIFKIIANDLVKWSGTL